MIGHIRGTLLDKTTNDVLVEAGGVGYEISLTMPAWFDLGEIGQEVSIWSHLVVREDVQQLFGFRNKDERLMFRGTDPYIGHRPQSSASHTFGYGYCPLN